MGVKVQQPYQIERVFENARDWYVTTDRVLQIYQKHDGDEEFVIMEYNTDCWESVEHHPLPTPPQPADADRPAVDEENDDV